MPRSLATLVFAFLFATCFGQNAIVRGAVVEKDGKTGIPAVHVSVIGENTGTITAGNGQFTLTGIRPGTIVLRYSCIGYSAVTDTLDIRPGSTTQVRVRMEESIFTLPDAIVDGGSITGGMQRLKDIPGSAYYLSPRTLQKFGYTDAHRVLSQVPGVHIQEEDGYGLRPNIGMRGSGSERSSKVTIMEDGVLAAPAPYAAPSAYYFPTVGRMSGVEILKGSSQVRYGPYTTGGALNFISTPIPDDFAGTVSIAAGSHENKKVHATIGNNHGQIAYLAEVFQYSSDGFKQLNDEHTGFDKKDYLVKLRWNTRTDAAVFQALTLKAGQTHEISNETYLGLTDPDFDNTPYLRYTSSQKDQMNARHEQVTVQHALRLPFGLSVQTTGYRHRFRRNWYKLDRVRAGSSESIASILNDPGASYRHLEIVKGTSTTQDEELEVKANNRTYQSEGIQGIVRWGFERDRASHTFEAGFRFHHDLMDRYQWVDRYQMQDGTMHLLTPGTPGTESNRIESADARAFYFTYHMAIDRVHIYPGFRHEHMTLRRSDYGKTDPDRTGSDLSSRENTVSTFLPGVGAEVDVGERHSLFAGVHEGFAPPGSNAGARPEQSVNYELGWRFTKNSLNAEAVLFYNDYENLLGADIAAAGGSGSTDTYNGGAAETFGIEVMLSRDIASGTHWHIPFNLMYTYTHGRFLSSFESTFEGWGTVNRGDAIPYIAPHRLSVQTGVTHRKYEVNWALRYSDRMRTVAGSTPGGLTFTETQLVVDLSVHYRVRPAVRVFGSIRNLTDAVYIVARRPAGVRPGLPRTAEVGIAAEF